MDEKLLQAVRTQTSFMVVCTGFVIGMCHGNVSNEFAEVVPYCFIVAGIAYYLITFVPLKR